MTSMTATRESSSKKPPQWRYDVFLSFRGEDTRKNFTDHLYGALHQKGIVTYRDDPSLEKGENISSELLKAIEHSKYLVVIMSENYASSTWCLEELAKIVECTKGGKQRAIPIFYKVDPSDVRKQKGSFENAFAKHEATFADNMDKVQRWKNAMKEIANLGGWDSSNRHESQFIQDIVEDLKSKLGKKLSYAPMDLVGIESRMEDMYLHLALGTNDVRFIGISGMGGIGKSTLARALFDEIGAQFEGCSFLANIREVSDTLGLVHLQNKLLFDIIREKDLIADVTVGASVIMERLKHKRLLVVLDDVDGIDHLEYLARKSWFGLGSRIIITSRDEHLLLTHHVNTIYRAKELSNEEALVLFCSKAMGGSLTKEFASFTEQVIEYAKGLPLALTVLGSFLSGRNMIEWQSAVARLRENPNKQIFEALRISFDRLEEIDKAIFLDIACFFSGNDKNHVMQILDYCGFYPEIGVKVLIERSLLSIIDNRFMVHDLLQEMAWEIIKQESPGEPGKRSRLRFFDDINHVMTNNTGTERVEVIVLKLGDVEMVRLNADCLRKMTNLRLLVIGDAHRLPKIKYLSNRLRLLTLDCFPSNYLPMDLLPESLYELNLRHSHLRRLRSGKKIFLTLRHIDLSDSKYLMETPNFEVIPNLETLVLSGCDKLSKIHPSIGVLQSLKFLNLSGCKNLEELPDSICSLECLEELDISGTAIVHLPPNLRNLNNLKLLSCRGCKNRRSDIWSLLLRIALNRRYVFLPSLSGLSSLEALDISDCQLQEGGIPDDLGCLSSLEALNLSFNHFLTIPESIYQIPCLKILQLNCCMYLEALPRLPESILYVEANSCWNLDSISNVFIICTAGGHVCFLNCCKLLPENLEIPMAQKHSLSLLCYIIGCSVFSYRYMKTYLVAPSCEIPKWFTSQEDGSLLSFSIRDPLFKYKVSGFVICVSFLGQKQERGDQERMNSYYLLCEFGNTLGVWCSFQFPIRYIKSDCLWMGFVPRNLFRDDRFWKVRMCVSLRTLADGLKVTKWGILPLKLQRSNTFKRFFQSASSFPEDVSSIFEELAYRNVDFSSLKPENKHWFDSIADAPRRTCGMHSVPSSTFPDPAFRDAEHIYDLWCDEIKGQ